MSSCSIRWCGKNSKTSNYETDGITFHRFPKDPNIKELWIDCAKRENWFPSNYSVVCSRHFTEDCFYTKKSRRRLFDAAIPTLYLPVVTNDQSVLENASLMPSSSTQNESISTTSRTTKQKSNDLETSSHIHALTNKRLCRQVLQLKTHVKHKNITIKTLRDKLRYYKKRVASLKLIIKELEEKNLITAEDADILSYVK